MQSKRLKKVLQDGKKFAVTVELSGAPNFGMRPIEHFMKGFNASTASIPDGFEFVGLTCTQSPGGAPGIEPLAVLTYLHANDMLGDLDFIPHISCKDHNADALRVMLDSFKTSDIESMLVVTGDKPLNSKGVFDLESVGLLDMITDLNAASYTKAKIDDLDNVHQFYASAAVSPFKYSEASQMQQYYKMEKKIACGAEFLITQVGWDWKKSLELMQYLKERNLNTPVMGNVFMLTSTTAAPRLMHNLKLPGCFVSEEFLARLNTESLDQHVERAAEQVAMYRSIGAAGVDIGAVHDYDQFITILNRAAEIGDDWQQYKDNLCWPEDNGFYLYNNDGSRVRLSKPKKKFMQKNFEFVHKAVLDEAYPGFNCFKKVMKALGTEKGKGLVYKSFNVVEKGAKYVLFECESCGDCFLPENYGLCTMGGCEKGLANVPCGDSTIDGRCGNNLDRTCIGDRVYNAAAAANSIDEWISTVCQPRDIKLDKTSSILNYLFGVDHTQKSSLISIGESIDGYSPKTGAVMKQLASLGEDAYIRPSGARNYIKALIQAQTRGGLAHMLVNIDAIFQDNQAVEAIRQYVGMVKKWSRGISPAIESNDKQVLLAGLEQWYDGDANVAKPLLIAPSNMLRSLLAMKNKYAFRLGAIVSGDTSEQMCTDAQVVLKHAIAHGIEPEDVFFVFTNGPLAKDPSATIGSGPTTAKILNAIKNLKADPATKKSHSVLRISLAAAGLKRSVGVCRAYVEKAMEYGLDAAIVNSAHKYGSAPAAKDLLDIVDTLVKMDDSQTAKDNAQQALEKLIIKKK